MHLNQVAAHESRECTLTRLQLTRFQLTITLTRLTTRWDNNKSLNQVSCVLLIVFGDFDNLRTKWTSCCFGGVYKSEYRIQEKGSCLAFPEMERDLLYRVLWLVLSFQACWLKRARVCRFVLWGLRKTEITGWNPGSSSRGYFKWEKHPFVLGKKWQKGGSNPRP